MAATNQWDNEPGLLESLWRYRWLVLVALLLGGAAGLGLSQLQSPVYEAEARLLLTDPRSVGVFQELRPGSPEASRYVRNQAQRMTSQSVLDRASTLMEGRLDPIELEELVVAAPAVDLDLITIRGQDYTAEGAAQVTNAVAAAYQQLVAEEVQNNAAQAITQLDETGDELRATVSRVQAQLATDPENPALLGERDAAMAQLATIESRTSQIAVDASLYGSGVQDLSRALPPEAPVQPRPLRTTAAGMLLALVVAGALAWRRAIGSDRLEEAHQPARILGAPLLGEVFDYEASGVQGPAPTVTAPKTAVAEAYQFIVASLSHAVESSGGNTIVVTSAQPGDGKTLTALNTAIAASGDGRTVILVDADDRMRGLAEVCSIEEQTGLTSLASDAVPFEWAIAAYELFDSAPVQLVPMGIEADDPGGFFRSYAFRHAIERVRSRGDLVIMDSPPLLLVAETSAIAARADWIVLVVAEGTSARVLEEAKARLDFIGTPLLGYVFNRSAPRKAQAYGGYVYGYQPEVKGNGRGFFRRRTKVGAET